MSIDTGSACRERRSDSFIWPKRDVHETKVCFFFFRFFADLNRNRNTSLKSQAGFCVQFIYGIRSAGRPSDKVFLLERIALLQEPMKVKIYISFYFVVLFFI